MSHVVNASRNAKLAGARDVWLRQCNANFLGRFARPAILSMLRTPQEPV